MKIKIISGNFFDSTGYGCHTRNLFSALVELNPEIQLDIPLFQGFERLCNDRELIAIKNKFNTEDCVVIAITQPQIAPLILSDKPKAYYQYVVWEGSNVPKDFITYLLDERVTGILVPSLHVRQAIMMTALKEYSQSLLDSIMNKIHVVHHGFDPSIFQPQEKEPNQPFTFIANKGWRLPFDLDRGGLQFVLKSYIAEFKEDEGAELRIKVNVAYLNPGINFEEELRKIGIPQRKDIKYMLGNIEAKDLVKIYNGDVFVSASMGDAFDIPVLEACACQLPCIATTHSGHTDYITEENGWLIGGELVDVTWDLQHEGNRWLKPSVDEIRAKMRHCFNNREEVIAKGKKSLETACKLRWRDSAKKLLNILWETRV